MQARGFCIGNLKLVDDKHFNVFVNALRGQLLEIILMVQIFEFALPDIFPVNRHEHGICVFAR
ncbi:hypothetical protein IMSAGC021_00516 [Muribaculaceae bacterium]|nr:hypothetical protein IMSAGC021_00516 [Muribaculaceae bacterium]